jgi:hypothetical protein
MIPLLSIHYMLEYRNGVSRRKLSVLVTAVIVLHYWAFLNLEWNPLIILNMKPTMLKAVLLLMMQWSVCISHNRVVGQGTLFDFDNAPLQSSLPINQTVDGITAILTATGQGYSIQAANVLGFTPAAFSGRIIYPNSIYLADLLVKFDVTIVDFSIMYSCHELGCDDAATMRVTAYKNGALVGTNTRVAANPGTWPTDTLRCSFAAGFDSVVVHYDKKPPTCQDYGVIFMADNMKVTASASLPVTLTYFDCETIATSTILKWEAAVESNLDGYIAEYSKDGVYFFSLGKINPEGPYHPYRFVHCNSSNTAYYRLKIVDMDGSYKYSKTRTVFIKPNTDLRVIPNPATDRICIYTNLATDSKVVTFISVSGTVVKIINPYLDGEPIRVDDLPKGTYLIKATTKDRAWSKFILKI